jgi:hypothetical protein
MEKQENDWVALPKNEKYLGEKRMRSIAEHIELGNTLITESKNAFLDRGCGCAIGSALASVGYDANKAKVEGIEERFRVEFPKVKTILTPKEVELFEKVAQEEEGYDPKDDGYGFLSEREDYSLESLISWTHIKGVPRMDIAKIVREIEISRGWIADPNKTSPTQDTSQQLEDSLVVTTKI